MMRKISLLIAIVFAILPLQATQKIDITSDCTKWVEKCFHRGAVPPFSFVYDGMSSSELLPRWKFSRYDMPSCKAGQKRMDYVWVEPGKGLQVRCEVKIFDDFNAVEWVLYFKNLTGSDSKPVREVKVFDVALDSENGGEWTICHAKGSNASRDDFMAETTVLGEGVEHFEMSPYGGRSSSHAFPFFNVMSDGSGAVFAIGWTGTWLAGMDLAEDGSLNVSTGMKFLDTFLHPGEEIRTPSTAMLLWKGQDRMDGQNLFRRFILAYHFPVDRNGRNVEYPICTSFNYGDPYPCNEYTGMTACYGKALVKRYKQFGIVPDVFWLDAGWYETSDEWQTGHDWCNSTGTWTVDSLRFPNGLGEIADEVHKVGAKFMVWFEPERVARSSRWAHEHPEYLLSADGKPAMPEEELSYNSHIVNLADPEARLWMTENIKKLIADNRIDYYRQDYNLDPEGFWAANDEPGRRGICEIGYICGLYRFWDDLREAFPDLIIDNCASGGRRLDMETVSRAAPLWRTDYQYGEPVGYQCHTYSLCQWLPVHGTGVASSDNYTFRSSLSWSVITNWSVTSPDSDIRDMQAKLKEFKDVRPYFLEDFYPLSGYGDITGDDVCLAYQLLRPSDQSGYIVAFRRKDSSVKSITVQLRGLSDKNSYVLEDVDTGKIIHVGGEELESGYVIELDCPETGRLIKYSLDL